VPSEKNAHPHTSGGVSVVHNGIIENHEEMRKRLRAKATSSSPTPTPSDRAPGALDVQSGPSCSTR